jgi:hypothetical protein
MLAKKFVGEKTRARNEQLLPQGTLRSEFNQSRNRGEIDEQQT